LSFLISSYQADKIGFRYSPFYLEFSYPFSCIGYYATRSSLNLLIVAFATPLTRMSRALVTIRTTSLEVKAKPATVISRPPNRRAREHAFKSYQVKRVCQVLNVELS